MSFLTKCIDQKVVPKGLTLFLEPMIGNHDQEFLDNWYGKLKSFSFSMIQDIVKFCDKTLTDVKSNIKCSENTLKRFMEQEEFNEINKTIKINEEATKKVLERRKFNKLNHLKYNQSHLAIRQI